MRGTGRNAPTTTCTFPSEKLVLTKIPPTFFFSLPPASEGKSTYTSLGHLSRTRVPLSEPSARSSRHARTTASPTRYCTKTRRGAGSADADAPRGARTRMENCKHPGGESHVLEPRPRPASWNVARETIGVGSDARKRGFLRFGAVCYGRRGTGEVCMWCDGERRAYLSSIVCVLVTASP